MQILPAIDLRGGKCVRLRQGDYDQETIFGDNPVEMARRWADEGAERLHLVDLDGARQGAPVNTEIIRQIVSELAIPCQLGGGIRNEESIVALLDDVGIDRVIVGTAALKQPDWFKSMCKKYPGRLVLGLDARDSQVATEGWLEVSEMSAIELAMRYTDVDLAAVVYTNIANDGMMQGIDQQTIDDMVQLAEMGLPVIASGGVTTMHDVRRLTEVSRQQPNLVGAIIGRAIYEGGIQVSEAVAISR
jgi:phosphoribosylformimino-5-aminoimidazole carboxamide ribotide isomerase